MFEHLPQLFQKYFLNTLSYMSVVHVFEIIIIGFIIFKIYRYITGTHAEQLLKGILMLLVALLMSKLFHLEIIGKILESVVNIVIFSLVVIFQPELRRFLGYLGQRGFLNKSILNTDSESEVIYIIDQIVDAVKYLSKSHVGALIVFENTKNSVNSLEIGTKLNAKISTELLLTIFHPNTPLHDGALVINDDVILASGVLLPLTEDPELSWQYGTRHRAAIGMSETSDATCLVVSEETGNISIAQGGNLVLISDLEKLRSELEFLYGVSESLKDETKKEIDQKSKFRLNSLFTADFTKYPGFLFKKK